MCDGNTNGSNKTMCISLAGILSHESLPVMVAVDMVRDLVASGRKLTPQAQDLIAFTTTTPRDWVHISFNTNLDSKQLDLYLLVEPASSAATGGLTFSMRYNQKLFARDTMEAMMRCWETLLANVQVCNQKIID